MPLASPRPKSCLIMTLCCLLLSRGLLLHAQTAISEEPVRAKHAMVVTIHHDATDAGLAILKQGGNAIDAAVAVAFTLAVVHPQDGNLGGGGFMLIRTNHGKTHFLDYREKAPAAATRDMYLDEQKNVIPELSTVGYKASGVPGTVAGLVYAQGHFGKLTLQQDMAPAIHFATDGYVLSSEEAQNLRNKLLSRFPTTAHIFQRDGDFYKEGDTFKQPLLAATLTRIAANPEDFYKGEMAKQIAAFEKAGGGLITAADLAAYEVKDREPVKGAYHGYKIITAPPPSSGGIVLVEILNILSTYDLPKLGTDRSAPQVHVITEAFRRAYMDRADYLGDPDFTPQPIKEMANPAYAAAWRSSIQPNTPTPSKDLVRPTGFMPPPPQLQPATHESTQTTHFSIVDADGNAVANTYTLQQHLRVWSYRRRPRLSDERRDGRLRLEDGRAKYVRSHPGSCQLNRSRQTPALCHDPHHRHHEGKHLSSRQTRLRARHSWRFHHHHHGGKRLPQRRRQRSQHPAGGRRPALPPPIPS